MTKKPAKNLRIAVWVDKREFTIWWMMSNGVKEDGILSGLIAVGGGNKRIFSDLVDLADI